MRHNFLLAIFILSSLYSYAGLYDFAGIINSSQEFKMDSQLVSYEQKTGVRLTIVTVTPDKYTQALSERAGRNEILLFIIPSRKICIANVGAGLQKWITDTYASLVLSQNIYSAFDSQRYGDGIESIVSEFTKKIGGLSLYEREAILMTDAIEAERSKRTLVNIGMWLLSISALILIVYFPLSRRRLLLKAKKEKADVLKMSKAKTSNREVVEELVRQDD